MTSNALIILYKIIDHWRVISYRLRTVQHSDYLGHTLGFFIGVFNVGQVKVLYHSLDDGFCETTGLQFIITFDYKLHVRVVFVP